MNYKLQCALAATIGIVHNIHNRPLYRDIAVGDFSVMLEARKEIFGKEIKKLWVYYDNFQRVITTCTRT
jgi:hypothetical protein